MKLLFRTGAEVNRCSNWAKCVVIDWFNIFIVFSDNSIHIIYHQSNTRECIAGPPPPAVDWLWSYCSPRFIFQSRFPFKVTVARDFLASIFFMDLLLRASDFEATRIFFYFSFSRSYSNISMNLRCRLLRGFKNIFLKIPKLKVKFDRY
jgi:hypothetical protein